MTFEDWNDTEDWTEQNSGGFDASDLIGLVQDIFFDGSFVIKAAGATTALAAGLAALTF